MSNRNTLVRHHLELSVRWLNHDDIEEAIRELVEAIGVMLRDEPEQQNLAGL